MEMNAYEPMPDEEGEAIEETEQGNKLTLENLSKEFQLFNTLLFYDMDTSVRALKLKQTVEKRDWYH